MDVYYLTGSPCSGKSTLAGLLAPQSGLEALHYDDYMLLFMQQLAEGGNALFQKMLTLSPEETWMRPPEEMKAEEWQMYDDMLPLMLQEVENRGPAARVMLEGAGLPPGEMKRRGVPYNRYLCMVPTPAFQLEKYAQRPWAKAFLQGCTDPDAAFQNWMQRDMLMAEAMHHAADEAGYRTIVVDGSKTIEQTAVLAKAHFGL